MSIRPSRVAEPAGAAADAEQENRPSMLVLGHEVQAKALSMMAQRAGLDCLGAFTLGTAHDQLGWTCPADHILLDLRDGAMRGEMGVR